MRMFLRRRLRHHLRVAIVGTSAACIAVGAFLAIGSGSTGVANAIGTTSTTSTTGTTDATRTSAAFPAVPFNQFSMIGVAVHLSLPPWSSKDGPPRTITDLPPGLTYSASAGIVTGTPTADGVYTVKSGLQGSSTGPWIFQWSVAAPVTGPGGLCIDDPQENTAVGTQLQVEACAKNMEQAWAISSIGEWLGLGNTCVTAGGSEVVLAGCSGQANQLWKAQSNGEVVNTASGQCMDDPKSGAAGAKLDLVACGVTATAGETWTVPAVGSSTTSGGGPTTPPTTSTGGGVTVASPGNVVSGLGVTGSVQIRATGSGALTYKASGLPAGVSINASTGTISGTPTMLSTGTVTVTVTDATKASGHTSFTWTVMNSVKGINPGNQAVSPGAAVSIPIHATDAPANKPLQFQAGGLPTGLSINATTGVISGTTKRNGAFPVEVVVMDGAEYPGIVKFLISVGATIVGPGGLCVDDPEQITTDGTPLQVWACDQTVAQSFATGAGTSVRVMGKCLAVVASKVVLRTCNGTPGQGWKVSSGELVNTGTKKCLDDPSSGGEGTKLTVATCTGSAEQKWQMS